MCGQLNCLVTLFASVTLMLKILCWSASPLDFAEMSEPCALTAATKIAELRAEIRKQKAAIAALTRKRKVVDTSRACASETAWPFVVRGALVVWAMRSDADLAETFLEKMATEPSSCGALVPRAIARENSCSDGDREGTVAEANNLARREGSYSSEKIPDRKVFVRMGGKTKY